MNKTAISGILIGILLVTTIEQTAGLSLDDFFKGIDKGGIFDNVGRFTKVTSENSVYINKLTAFFPEDALAATIKNVDDYEDVAGGAKIVMGRFKGGLDEFEGTVKICSSPCRAPTKAETAKNVKNIGNAIRKNIPVKSFKDLPTEAQETVDLIQKGGPFPFKEDGAIFKNNEMRLPKESEGYYKEYTVVKKGETKRGFKRIVTGSSGEMYYTEDHYKTFEVILNDG